MLGLLLALLLALLAPLPAQASAKMFPSNLWSGASGPALPLRSLSMEATVDHGLAKVRSEYRFENGSYSQIEVLFRTRIPRHAVVTDFAYWFKGIRVPGKIMENEEAEAIYRAITSAGRDPALLRRTVDGGYEARIFPVEPRSDVRVELEYRYAVPERQGSLAFTYPLTAGRTGQPIDRVDLRVRFLGDRLRALRTRPGGARLERGAGVAAFTARRLDPRADFRVAAVLSPASPRTETLAGSGPRGRRLFALRVRGGTTKRPPQKGRHVFPLPIAAGSTTRYWVGQASEPGAASAAAPELAPFWAQAYTGALVRDYRRTRNRKTYDLVVRLSKEFRIDTEFTSYLAVPESEWAAYQEQVDQARRRPVEDFGREIEQQRWVAQLPRWVSPGDPVIRVKHRPELERVTAVLPDGDILPLRLDPLKREWEARFDIPEGAAEGAYGVSVILQHRDGSRHELVLTYHVDLTPPSGRLEKPQPGRARIEVSVPAGKTGDVARVVALLADGRRVDLSLDSASGRYRGGLGLPPGRHAVRVRLYDRVHNWVELEEEIDVH